MIYRAFGLLSSESNSTKKILIKNSLNNSNVFNFLKLIFQFRFCRWCIIIYYIENERLI